jgi:hypothetical protein
MPRFSTAPVEEVVPKRRQRQPSQRAQTQAQYREALQNALNDRSQALVVELEPEDKPLTIRNRIKRAAESLGLDSIAIRRRKDRIVAYLPQNGDQGT